MICSLLSKHLNSENLAGSFIMTRNIKIDINTLLEAFDLYEQGYSFLNVIKMLSLNTNRRLLSEKYQRYKLYGVNGLLPKTKNN